MKYQIDFRNIDRAERETLRGLIDERAGQLQEKLGSLSQQDLRLRGAVQKHGKHSLYRVGLSLHLPGRTVGVEEDAENAAAAVNAAFAELQRQALRHKSRLRNEHLWKRKSRRRELQALKTGAGADQSPAQAEAGSGRADWFAGIEPCLDRLYDFARHEITHLKQRGDLSADDIEPDELVDAVVVAAWERQAEKSASLDTESWLYRLAIELLDREVQRHAQRAADISTETVVSRGYDPDDDSIYEFYQPDEVLRVEDLIATTDEEPPFERRLPSLLLQLPADWRRPLLLQELSRLSPEQLAAVLETERARVEDTLAKARDFIAARLGEITRAAASRSDNPGAAMKRLVRSGCPQTFRDELKSKFGG